MAHGYCWQHTCSATNRAECDSQSGELLFPPDRPEPLLELPHLPWEEGSGRPDWVVEDKGHSFRWRIYPFSLWEYKELALGTKPERAGFMCQGCSGGHGGAVTNSALSPSPWPSLGTLNQASHCISPHCSYCSRALGAGNSLSSNADMLEFSWTHPRDTPPEFSQNKEKWKDVLHYFAFYYPVSLAFQLILSPFWTIFS